MFVIQDFSFGVYFVFVFLFLEYFVGKFLVDFDFFGVFDFVVVFFFEFFFDFFCVFFFLDVWVGNKMGLVVEFCMCKVIVYVWLEKVGFVDKMVEVEFFEFWQGEEFVVVVGFCLGFVFYFVDEVVEECVLFGCEVEIWNKEVVYVFVFVSC